LDELTCWRKYEQLPKPQSSIVRTRWRPSGHRGGTRRRSHAFGQDRRSLVYVSIVVRDVPGVSIRIFGSGTPRLNRDLGYGYEDGISVRGSSVIWCGDRDKEAIANSKSLHAPGKHPTHLILAVTVASRGSSCHLEVFRGGFRVLLS
jgi:hypothetical protein